jgi:hypothetical protein
MTYVRYDDSIEVIQPDEARLTKEICESMTKASKCAFDKWSHATRGQHAKSHGVLKGKLKVLGAAELPEYLRQGVFATPGREYDIIVRYSTGHGTCRSDLAPSPRAMAIKILGVEGERQLEGDTSTNQDFLLVNKPVYFGKIKSYWWVQRILLERQPKTSDGLARATAAISLVIQKAFKLFHSEAPIWIKAVGDEGHNILAETFHSMAAVRFGDYVAKISAEPDSPEILEFGKNPMSREDNGLRNDVVKFYEKNSAEYVLRAQLCTNLERMPVEDASVRWPDKGEGGSPHQPVARIVLPAQNADSPERRIYADEVLFFDPWRCLAAHRPLGSIMRVRKEAYKLSSDFRHAMNAQEYKEPRDILELPPKPKQFDTA